jgi:hypothetical protein
MERLTIYFIRGAEVNISIEVQASGGSDVAEIINAQCALANRLNIRVDCSLNGVKVMAQPMCDPADLYALWSEEMGSKRPYKIVCGHPAVEQAVSEYARKSQATSAGEPNAGR